MAHLKDMTEYDGKIISSDELSLEFKKKETRVFSTQAFKDLPGNSVVYAAPKKPGLLLGDFIPESLRDKEIGLRIECLQLFGEYRKTTQHFSYALVVKGYGKINSSLTRDNISSGDVILFTGENTLTAGANGLTIVCFELEEFSQGIEELLGEKVLYALQASFSSLVPQLTSFEKGYGFERISSPQVSAKKLASLAGCSVEKLLVAINSVEITGEIPFNEPPHHHLSNIFAIVYDGQGTLIEPKGIRFSAQKGDALIVPIGAKHYFEAPKGILSYCGIEFGKHGTDYQKHYHDEADSDKPL